MTAVAPARPPVGQLELSIGVRGERSIAVAQYHQGALRVIRPHYLDDSGQVYYTIVNPGGGYLGGDRYDLAVDVDDDASLLLTSQSATKVYRTPGEGARQDMRIRLGRGAVLEYVPDQLIAYREATYRQSTAVEMHSEATLVFAEVVTPGWAPDGSLFRYDEVRLRTEVSVEGRLALLDNLVVRPGRGPTDVTSLLFLEDRTHLGSLIAVDRRIDAVLVDDVRALLGESPTIIAGVSLTEGPGFVVRVLGDSTEQVTGALHGIVDALRARWRGQQPLHLRKY